MFVNVLNFAIRFALSSVVLLYTPVNSPPTYRSVPNTTIVLTVLFTPLLEFANTDQLFRLYRTTYSGGAFTINNNPAEVPVSVSGPTKSGSAQSPWGGRSDGERLSKTTTS